MATAREQPASWGDASVLQHADGLSRCPWAGLDPLYVSYHDDEWGRPELDGRALFEKLVLDGFQAGLSWITILRKRDAFRTAFAGFEPAAVASFDDKRLHELMQNVGIVRNRAKIEGAVSSARAWLDIEADEGFSAYLWGFVDGRPIVNHPRRMSDIPTQSPISERLSKDLKARGFKFCGPTIVYAFMQAVGMVDDHLVDCHVRAQARGKA
ncbi:MAG: DNA-3-methyladenine glycosylase I [Methylocystis sp.]|nr:MAG: DNA-3-methyladenine glycosylase I [Methylocystis sp.]